MPVWSCLSAAMMPHFVPPEGVHTVMVFVDVDRSGAGQRSVLHLEENLKEKGVRVLPMVPCLKRSPGTKSVDWANQLEADITGTSNAMQVVKTAFTISQQL